MIKRDYLERMIEELAGVFAKAMGLAREQKHEQASRELDAGYALIGVSALVIDRLDPASVRMLTNAEKIAALVQVLRTDAELSRLRGDEARARRREALADGLARA